MVTRRKDSDVGGNGGYRLYTNEGQAPVNIRSTLMSDWDDLCHYCENKADYYTNHTDLNICKHCVEEYVRQEVLTDIRR